MCRRALLLLLAAACGGASSPDGGQDGGLAPADVCAALAAARCNLMQRCYVAFERDAPDTCVSNQAARCNDEYAALQGSFNSGAARIDDARVQECQTRMNTSECPPSFPPGAFGVAHPFADCEWTTGLAQGLVDGGGLCARGIDCAPGTACVQVNGACRGTCAALGQLHQPCGAGCAPELFCDDHGSTDPSAATCEAPKGAGEACASSQQCQPELYCLSTCTPRGQLGDGCVFDPQRLSTCAPGLACDVTPFTSQTGSCVLPKGINGTCQFHWTCAPGLACSFLNYAGFPASAPTPGVCGPPAPSGTSCAFSAYANYLGTECAAGLQCGSNGKCDPIPKLGEACIPSSQECAGVNVYCRPSSPTSNVGTCTGPATVGQRCAFQIDPQNVVQIPCATGYCESQNTYTCLAATAQNGQLCTQDGQCVSGRCAVQQDRTQKCAPACLP